MGREKNVCAECGIPTDNWYDVFDTKLCGKCWTDKTYGKKKDIYPEGCE